MESPLTSYLSLRYESEEEQNYIAGLIDQFESAKMIGAYHLALFAYHLLFMTFIYQTIFKLKKWMPKRFKFAIITLSSSEKREYLETKSPWVYSKIKERTVLGLLHLFKDCDGLISKCKKEIIDFRNENLGHANPFIVSEDGFEKKIEEYNQIASEIHQLTHSGYGLSKIFNEYFKSIDPEIEQTKDDLELNLIGPNRLSDKDLEALASECLISPDFKKKQLLKILQDDFGVYLELE